MDTHTCTKDSIRIKLWGTDKGERTYWNTYSIGDWQTILEDMGLTQEHVGINTLERLKQVFSTATESLEHLESKTYEGFAIKIYCELFDRV